MLSGPQTTLAETTIGATPDDRIDPESTFVGEADRALSDGRDLLSWWQALDAVGAYADRFELIRKYNQSDRSFGFFDVAPLGDTMLPVMGVVEELLYDQPKWATPERVRDEFREFILHYFMRVSAYVPPEAYAEPGPPPLATFPAGLSWCPRDDVRKAGFGFSQLYYKRADTGQVGRFARTDRFACVDLREIGRRYAWTLCKVRIFDFTLTFRPFGPDAVALVVPLQQQNYLVLSPDFIANRDDPAPGVLGEYGFGYALIRDTTDDGVLAYGPGHFRAGFQLIHFRVLQNGETWARLVFVVNRPERILNVPLDPVGWSFKLADLMSLGFASRLLQPARRLLESLPLRSDGFDPISASVALANTLTGGFAAQGLCISRDQLEKDFLVQHYTQHYQMIVGSLLTWRHIPNWLDARNIPEAVAAGVSS